MTTRQVIVFVAVALVIGTAVFALRSEPADGTVGRYPVTYAGPAGPDSLVGLYEGRTPCGERFVEFAGGPAAGGHLVRMTLRWNYVCGRLCAISFSGSREVFISADGRIVEVRGDRRPVVIAA
jgi:hypothetical protein